MKLVYLLTSLLGAAVALEVSENQPSTQRLRRSPRPEKADGAAVMEARTPSGAPAGYQAGTSLAMRERSMSGLTPVPAHLTSVPVRRRRDSLHAARLAPAGVTSAQDFFECQNASPAPEEADCQVVIDQVTSSSQTSVVQGRACLTYVYQTCQGFFCALCETLATTTDFIGSQLDQIKFLCVADGKSGAIVGETSPQWDAGFVRAGTSLPTYDVC